MSNKINKKIELSAFDPCACIAMDVVNSEYYNNKEEIRVKLKKIAKTLNRRYRSVLAVPFQVRKGDEIVGVVSSFSHGYEIYRDVRRYAWKLEIELYFGLGLGYLDTGSILDVDEINGSAVINAFRAVNNHLKDEVFLKEFIYEPKKLHVQFYSLGTKHVPYKVINTLVYTIYNEYSGSTEKQKELVKTIELNPTSTYEELGTKMGYTSNARENVSKLLSRIGYEKSKQMQEDLIDLLKIVQGNLSERWEES